jgi:hypothetical protein
MGKREDFPAETMTLRWCHQKLFGATMKSIKRIAQSCVLLGLIGFVMGCIVEPREGYYDHDHHRYYRDHTWHECRDRDDYCR